jgi:hypothetical protein
MKHIDTFKLVLALSARYSWDIQQMDVDSAYLNGNLTHDVYTDIPQGYRNDEEYITTRRNELIANNKTHCFKVTKPVYGLVQAGREWNERLVTFINNELGYKTAVNDISLFKHPRFNNFILIYVDDILILGANNDEISRVKAAFNQEFEMKDLGAIRKFLGLTIERNMEQRNICISAPNYVRQIITNYDMWDDIKYPILRLPFNIHSQLSKDLCPTTEEEKSIMKIFPFRKLYGQLNWLMIMCRTDIAVAMGAHRSLC